MTFDEHLCPAGTEFVCNTIVERCRHRDSDHELPQCPKCAGGSCAMPGDTRLCMDCAYQGPTAEFLVPQGGDEAECQSADTSVESDNDDGYDGVRLHPGPWLRIDSDMAITDDGAPDRPGIGRNADSMQFTGSFEIEIEDEGAAEKLRELFDERAEGECQESEGSTEGYSWIVNGQLRCPRELRSAALYDRALHDLYCRLSAPIDDAATFEVICDECAWSVAYEGEEVQPANAAYHNADRY